MEHQGTAVWPYWTTGRVTTQWRSGQLVYGVGLKQLLSSNLLQQVISRSGPAKSFEPVDAVGCCRKTSGDVAAKMNLQVKAASHARTRAQAAPQQAKVGPWSLSDGPCRLLACWHGQDTRVADHRWDGHTDLAGFQVPACLRRRSWPSVPSAVEPHR